MLCIKKVQGDCFNVYVTCVDHGVSQAPCLLEAKFSVWWVNFLLDRDWCYCQPWRTITSTGTSGDESVAWYILGYKYASIRANISIIYEDVHMRKNLAFLSILIRCIYTLLITYSVSTTKADVDIESKYSAITSIALNIDTRCQALALSKNRLRALWVKPAFYWSE